jgi:hypothetical protein
MRQANHQQYQAYSRVLLKLSLFDEIVLGLVDALEWRGKSPEKRRQPETLVQKVRAVGFQPAKKLGPL